MGEGWGEGVRSLVALEPLTRRYAPTSPNGRGDNEHAEPIEFLESDFTEIDDYLFLPERAHQLIAQRLHQVGQHGAVAGLHEGFDRHAGDQLDVVAEAGDFFRRHRDPDGVVALAGTLVRGDVGGDPADDAVQFRRGALVEGRQPQHRFLADLQLVDILRIDLGFDREIVGLRHDHHDGVAGGDDAADGMDRGLQHHAGLRRADVDAAQLVFGGHLALDEFADLVVGLAQILGDFADHILVDLDDLQLGFGDLALGLRP